MERYTCKKCNTPKILDDFPKSHRRIRNGVINECKSCHNLKKKEAWRADPQRERDRHKAWREKNPDKVRERQVKARIRSYGITPERYEELVRLQNECCAICKRHLSSLKKRLFIDHCHKTGIVRGLLCVKCNHAIGLLNDDPKTVINAYTYLGGGGV